MLLPRTLGELRRSTFSEERLRTRRVKDETPRQPHRPLAPAR